MTRFERALEAAHGLVLTPSAARIVNDVLDAIVTEVDRQTDVHRAELKAYADATTQALDRAEALEAENEALRAKIAQIDPVGMARLFTAAL